MGRVKGLLLSVSALALMSGAAVAESPVVTSIKPVHSLVAAVMEGVGHPELIVRGASSPHDYALKPSEAAKLQDAKLIFWIGHQIETFLEKPIDTIASGAKSIELIDTHGLVKLKLREGGAFEGHDHDDHGHADHDDHDHDKKAEAGHDDHDQDDHDHGKKAEADHDDHDHDKKAEAGHDDHDHDDLDHGKKAEAEHDDHDHDKKAEAGHDDHDHDKKAEAGHDDHGHGDHGEFDAHVWLDPQNAKVMVHEIEEALAELDPANAAKYEANAKAVSAKLDALTSEVAAMLAPVKQKGFIVFHDAYQNFENRFGLKAAGSITVSPEVMPGADRVREIRAKVRELGATCVFAEPQFEPKLVSVVTEGTDAKSGTLDPLGATIDDGPELYFKLIRNMANSIRNCLAEAS